MDFDKLDLANLVLVTFRKFYQKVKQHGFEQIMDFSMDIDKLNLANLVGKVLHGVPDFEFFASRKKQTRDLQKIAKPP